MLKKSKPYYQFYFLQINFKKKGRDRLSTIKAHMMNIKMINKKFFRIKIIFKEKIKKVNFELRKRKKIMISE